MKILEAVRESTVGTADLVTAILMSGYGASQWRIMREFERRQSARARETLTKDKQKEIIKQQKQRYYNLIYKLKQGGLIKEEYRNRSGQRALLITKRGMQKLKRLKKQKRNLLSNTYYPKELGTKIIIVAFDIPEKERKKRNWLRLVLKRLNFTIIQKSVWVGKTKIPKAFIDDLYELELIDFVEIFEVGNKGSLKHII